MSIAMQKVVLHAIFGRKSRFRSLRARIWHAQWAKSRDPVPQTRNDGVEMPQQPRNDIETYIT